MVIDVNSLYPSVYAYMKFCPVGYGPKNLDMMMEVEGLKVEDLLLMSNDDFDRKMGQYYSKQENPDSSGPMYFIEAYDDSCT